MVGRIRREGELERERASRECVSVWRKTGDREEQILSLLQRLEDGVSIMCPQHIQAALPMGTQHRHSSHPFNQGTLLCVNSKKKKKKSLAEYSSEYNATAVKELGGSINLLMRFSTQALSLPVGNNYI